MEQVRPDPTAPEPSPIRAARVTTVEHVYHQVVGGNPVELPTARFTQELDTDEQVWHRVCKVGERWTALDRGWITTASLLRITNAVDPLQNVPTPEEASAAAAQVIEVATVFQSKIGIMEDDPDIQPFMLVHPGQTRSIEPAALPLIFIRCRSGIARVTITLIPS